MKNDILRSTQKRLSALSMAVFLLFSGSQYAYAATPECNERGILDDLPELVLKTRSEIIAQATTGNLAPMLQIAEQSEIWPVPDFGPDADYNQPPTASWHAQSQDTDGRYILAQMIVVLNMPYLKKPLNGGVDLYIWPYFAESDLTNLCPSDMVELLKIVPPTEYLTSLQTGAYTGFQMAISTDGTWQYFARKNLDTAEGNSQ